MDASASAEEQFRRGLRLLADGEQARALRHFETAHGLEPGDARYRSHYGLALALVERRFERALELCRAAAQQELTNAELYHNLARVHLAFGFKAEAIRYLQRVVEIDPGHEPGHEALARLGERRSPVLRFLPRRHAINRWLGRIRRLRSVGR